MSSSAFDSIEHQARQYHYGGLVGARNANNSYQNVNHQTHSYLVGAHHISPTFSSNQSGSASNNNNYLQHGYNYTHQQSYYAHYYSGNQTSFVTHHHYGHTIYNSRATMGYTTIRHDNL